MPHFRLKIRGEPGAPGSSPGSATADVVVLTIETTKLRLNRSF